MSGKDQKHNCIAEDTPAREATRVHTVCQRGKETDFVQHHRLEATQRRTHGSKRKYEKGIFILEMLQITVKLLLTTVRICGMKDSQDNHFKPLCYAQFP